MVKDNDLIFVKVPKGKKILFIDKFKEDLLIKLITIKKIKKLKELKENGNSSWTAQKRYRRISES